MNAFETLEVTNGPPKVPRRWPMGGWLFESGWLTTRKPGVKRSFVDLKIAKNEKLAEIWRQVLSF